MIREEIFEKIKIRLPDAEDALVEEYAETVSDRLCIRLGTDVLPKLFYGIASEAVVKMYRRTYYEGISSESAANISTTFIDDILKEYDTEISSWRSQHSGESNARVVRFL